MAKVKITGHASGSGVITVTAPNTSTDRTITLPDSTDTLIGTATTDALTTRVNGAGGRKNMIINGAMNVAQRGASQAGYTAAGYYTCDRWFHDKDGSTGTFTMTQEADAPDGFKNSLKVNCTTAGSSGAYNAIQTRLESQDTAHLAYGTSSAKAITLSFWVKVSQTGNQQMNLIHHADAGSRQISFVYTINQANTWEKKTVTFAGDTTRVGDDDNTNGFYLEWFLSSYSGRTGSSVLTSWGSYTNTARFEGATISIGDSTSDTWQIAGVQLEVGSVATDFEYRSYGEELALCQRYYQRFGAPDDAQVLSFAGMCVSASVVYFAGQTYVPMRAQPSGSSVNPSNFRVRNASNSGIPSISSLGVSAYSPTHFIATAENASGLTAGHASHLFNYTGSQYGYVQLDAEL